MNRSPTSEIVLITIGADLLVVTEDNTALVHHTSQSASELVGAVVAMAPQIVLMDGALANDIKGSTLVARLRQELPNCCVIAHSANQELNEEMLKAGAFDQISKSAHNSSIELIAAIYARFRGTQNPAGTDPQGPGSLAGERVTGPLTGLDVEALVAFSILTQGYELATATEEERVAMGIPPGTIDADAAKERLGELESSDWRLAPFAGMDLERYMPLALARCPLLRSLIGKLQSGPRIELSREEVRNVREEIERALEPSWCP